MASQPFQLVMRTGPTPGKVFELKQDELTVGRDIGNNIVINDPEISRRHARLSTQAGNYVIEDMGSTNGTFVNGQRLIGPHVLRHGETVMFGEKVGLEFQAMQYDPNATLISGAPAAPQPAPRVAETYRVAMPPEPEPGPSPAYPPVYSGQVPPGPGEPYMPQAAESYETSYETPVEEKPKSRTYLYVGIGCLVVLLCVCVVGIFAFDAMNLYCTGPFKSVMDALGFVCP
jgi:predicted component of type VI protein secretion system